MSKPLFVDVHILQSVPPSNINRDDTGSPTTARFGGATRARVSSQAWKKATRDLFPMYVDSSQLGERTKYAVQLIADRAMELDEDLQEEGALKAAKEVLSKYCEVPSKKKLSFEREDKNKLKTLIFLSQAEIEQLAQCVVGNEQVENLKEKDLTRDALDVAMFGRMVATKPELNVDAAVQVAHAISVGRVETEFDYFTALDDRRGHDRDHRVHLVDALSLCRYRRAPSVREPGLCCGGLQGHRGISTSLRALDAHGQAELLCQQDAAGLHRCRAA